MIGLRRRTKPQAAPANPVGARALRAAAETAAAPFPPLMVEAARVAATVAQGVHGRRRPGSGDAFWQHRLLEAHDSPRSIDWRRSARGGDIYVQDKEWEAAQTVWIWRDGSASMDWTGDAGRPTKRRRASVLALALTALLIRAGERVGTFGGPVASGRRAFDLAAEAFGDESAAASGPPAAPPHRDSTVVWISDCLDPVADLAAGLAASAQAGARGVLMQVLDPAEESLPFKGRVRFSGLEGEGDLLIGDVGAAREAWSDLMTARRAALTDAAGRFGWRFLQHHTDRSAESALLALHGALARQVD